LPAEISALVPDFLVSVPRDPMDGQPLRYKRQDAGDFLLYSVGLDGNDDGGDPRPPGKAGTTFPWQYGRDWVWPRLASQEEIDADNARLETQRNRSRRKPIP
jgi:hypothetical protein